MKMYEEDEQNLFSDILLFSEVLTITDLSRALRAAGWNSMDIENITDQYRNIINLADDLRIDEI